MKTKIFFLLISVLFLLPVNLARAEEGTGQPEDIPYPEEKYHEIDYSVMNKAKEGLESLYMKTPPPTEGVDLKKIDKTFFREGTVGEKKKDYLKEAGKNRWEEWSPVFYEFGKVLKKQGKQIYHEWFFPDQKRKKITTDKHEIAGDTLVATYNEGELIFVNRKFKDIFEQERRLKKIK